MQTAQTAAVTVWAVMAVALAAGAGYPASTTSHGCGQFLLNGYVFTGPCQQDYKSSRETTLLSAKILTTTEVPSTAMIRSLARAQATAHAAALAMARARAVQRQAQLAIVAGTGSQAKRTSVLTPLVQTATHSGLHVQRGAGPKVSFRSADLFQKNANDDNDRVLGSRSLFQADKRDTDDRMDGVFVSNGRQGVSLGLRKSFSPGGQNAFAGIGGHSLATIEDGDDTSDFRGRLFGGNSLGSHLNGRDSPDREQDDFLFSGRSDMGSSHGRDDSDNNFTRGMLRFGNVANGHHLGFEDSEDRFGDGAGDGMSID